MHPQPDAFQGRLEVGDVEISEYVDRFNHRRLHSEIGLIPPSEFETNYWASTQPEQHPETPVLTRPDPSYRASKNHGLVTTATRRAHPDRVRNSTGGPSARGT